MRGSQAPHHHHFTANVQINAVVCKCFFKFFGSFRAIIDGARHSSIIFANTFQPNVFSYASFAPLGTCRRVSICSQWQHFVKRSIAVGYTDWVAYRRHFQSKNYLQGRKVETPSKGLYIIDGKKVLVK